MYPIVEKTLPVNSKRMSEFVEHRFTDSIWWCRGGGDLCERYITRESFRLRIKIKR